MPAFFFLPIATFYRATATKSTLSAKFVAIEKEFVAEW